mmetsp:Transcript_9260/g.17691  ORF Transcript_9260/g.17691 Transcript_9260/m.17691 type:complete len:111 (+) Transcript_9260:1127-1459(+)
MLAALVLAAVIAASESPETAAQNSIFPKTKPLNFKTYESLDCAKLTEKCMSGGDCEAMETFCKPSTPLEEAEHNEHLTIQLAFVLVSLALLGVCAFTSCKMHREALIHKL